MLVNNGENNKKAIPFNRLRQYIYKLIRRRVLTSEDAEDITQTVLLKGWQSHERNYDRQSFETESDFFRYFSIIAANEINRFLSEQIKTVNTKDEEKEILLMIPTDQLSPEYCLEIIQDICSLSLKQRLALILGEQKLLNAFLKVFSYKTIAEMMQINESLLEKLGEEIPLDDEDIKYVIEIMMDNKLKTSVRDERWKARKSLKGIIHPR